MTKPTERYIAFAFGVVFVIVLLVLATAVPHPTPFQYTVFRIVLALAAGGVAAMIPGFLTVDIPKFLRAGGALAVFVIVYFYSPAELAGVKVKTEQDLEIEKPVVSDGRLSGDLALLPIGTAGAQSSPVLPSLVVTAPDQLQNPEVWGKRYQSVTIDGVRAEVAPRSVIVANELSALRGGTLVGRDITIVARRMANMVIDVNGSQTPAVPAGSARLFVKVVENTRVLASGASGTAGAAGAPGTAGEDGANGRNGRCDGFGGYRGAGRGGNGGDGSNGGDGQPGTDGQPGGQIVLTAIVNPVSSAFDVGGGQGGRGGAGGTEGAAGRAGVGGEGCTGLGGSQSNAPDGVSGRPGRPGIAGQSGAPGQIGEYRLVIVRSFDDIVAKLRSNSNAQLHAVLLSP